MNIHGRIMGLETRLVTEKTVLNELKKSCGQPYVNSEIIQCIYNIETLKEAIQHYQRKVLIDHALALI